MTGYLLVNNPPVDLHLVAKRPGVVDVFCRLTPGNRSEQVFLPYKRLDYTLIKPYNLANVKRCFER